MICEYSLDFGKPVIHYWCRNKTQKIHKKIKNFKPYFYILSSEKDKLQGLQEVVSIEEGYKSVFKEDVIKVFVNKPSDVPNIRNLFTKTFEADILFPIRFLIDEEPDFGDKPKMMYFDIEVLNEKGIFPDPLLSLYPISSISFTSSFSEKYISLFLDPEAKIKVEEKIWINRITNKEHQWKIYNYSTEEELLNAFLDFVQKGDPDFFTGWNTDFFDLPYLINRMNRVGVNSRRLSPLGSCFVPEPSTKLHTGKVEQNIPIIKGRGIFDLLIPYRKMNISQLQSKTLGNVGKLELGVDKLPFSGDLSELYNNDKELYLKYNMADVEIAKELDKKIGITDYFWELSKFIGCKFGDTMSASRMIDTYILRYTKKVKKLILPSKTPTPPETFEGAIVLDPITGLHDNVVVMDLSKLYPSIIISMNFSPETLVRKEDIEKYGKENLIEVGNGLYFKKERGFSPEVLAKLFELEDERKKIMKEIANTHGYDSKEYFRASRNRQFVKDLRNAYYGILSYKGFRMYVPDVGASVTYMGRKIITHCKAILEKEGLEIVSGDTDSLFYKSKKITVQDIKKEALELRKKINISFDEFAKSHNIDKHQFKIEYEKIYGKVIILSKKRYKGIIIEKDNKEVKIKEDKGIETKRSDTSQYTKNILNEVLDNILDGQSEVQISSLIQSKIKDFKLLTLDKIGIPKGVNQNIDEYKTKSAHIRGCEYSNRVLGTLFNKGSKNMMVYVSKVPKGFEETDVITFDSEEQIPKDFLIDYERMINVLIVSKIEKIYEVLDWDINKITFGSQQKLTTFGFPMVLQ